ncbi:hypothetical protein PQQ88_27580 [Paraburkholderia caledonica]|uniref:hypothetical protein n=1 Tax=Paraburkholderia caledonica TaxID=134536 RepID=UPI0038B7FBC2
MITEWTKAKGRYLWMRGITELKLLSDESGMLKPSAKSNFVILSRKQPISLGAFASCSMKNGSLCHRGLDNMYHLYTVDVGLQAAPPFPRLKPMYLEADI